MAAVGVRLIGMAVLVSDQLMVCSRMTVLSEASSCEMNLHFDQELIRISMFDTPTFFGRDLSKCKTFAKAWYGAELDKIEHQVLS